MKIKKHVADGRRLILAVCDDDLLGKRFEEKGRQLDIRPEFYGEQDADEKEVVALIGKAYIVNASGEEAVACCAKAGLCKKDDAPRISGIPYFQGILF